MYHRLATGLQIGHNQGAIMRFLTLTSSTTSPTSIKKSFDKLRKRIERAKYEKDRFHGFKMNRYYCLRTTEGNGVLHILYWGHFIPQEWISEKWKQIHDASIVDIRKCYTNRRTVNGIVGYLLTHYLKNQPIKRMSYGWRWAWLGFCKSWKNVKDTYGSLKYSTGSLQSVITHTRANSAFYSDNLFRHFQHGHNHSVQAWWQILLDHPRTSRQIKLTSKQLRGYFGVWRNNMRRIIQTLSFRANTSTRVEHR